MTSGSSNIERARADRAAKEEAIRNTDWGATLPKAWVIPHPEQGERMALYDQHPAYGIGGEIAIHGQNSEPVEVPLTPGVLGALAPQGDTGTQPSRLVRVEGPALEAARQRASVAREQREIERERYMATVTPVPPPPLAANAAERAARDSELERRQLDLLEEQARLNERLRATVEAAEEREARARAEQAAADRAAARTAARQTSAAATATTPPTPSAAPTPPAEGDTSAADQTRAAAPKGDPAKEHSGQA